MMLAASSLKTMAMVVVEQLKMLQWERSRVQTLQTQLPFSRESSFFSISDKSPTDRTVLPWIKQSLSRHNIGSQSLEDGKGFKLNYPGWNQPPTSAKLNILHRKKIVALLRSVLIWQPRCKTPTIHLVKLNNRWLAELVRTLNLT